MEPLVSVIVPAYNIREYIDKCVSSIVGQTLRPMEIILVDDGSADGTGDLCDAWARRDPRIRALHQENGGVVSARNAGLATARGEFTLCVDGDDWIEPAMAEDLLRIARSQDADIVTSGFFSGGSEKPELDTLPEGLYAESDEPERREFFFSRFILNGFAERWGVLPGVCFKLIRTDLLRAVHSGLDRRILIGEDAAVTYGCCMKARRIAVTSRAYYHYIVRGSSATHTRSKTYLAGQELLHGFLSEQAQGNPYYRIIKRQVDLYATRQILMGLSVYMGIDPENTLPYLYFRDERIPKGARIVLYGAGAVGQAYYRQIKAEGLYEIAAWVDGDFRRYQEKGLPVGPAGSIGGLHYDYIVAAVKRASMAEEIRRQLAQGSGVGPERVLWTEPGSYLDRYLLFEGRKD